MIFKLSATRNSHEGCAGSVIAPLVIALFIAGCSSPPPTKPLPAVSEAVPGSAPGPLRGSGSYAWTDEMDSAARELQNSVGREGVEVLRTNDNRLWLLVAGDNFEMGRGAVKPASGALLDKIAATLQARPRLEIRVVGHTDARGDAAGNDALSVDRAASVRDWLVMRGVPAMRFSVAGRGARDPIANNQTDEGRASNRRVELLLGVPAR